MSYCKVSIPTFINSFHYSSTTLLFVVEEQYEQNDYNPSNEYFKPAMSSLFFLPGASEYSHFGASLHLMISTPKPKKVVALEDADRMNEMSLRCRSH